ncbi:hypothetical protein [Achromobacter xylosoxidans]|uniref:hypothetical protein n=1 Tax=Alcaligenes xylosoxydans xylosoxydans TaxID=85698 RepID=UPI000AA9B517|nr:hypothetical protein [Achromobacter xylosoxidans]
MHREDDREFDFSKRIPALTETRGEAFLRSCSNAKEEVQCFLYILGEALSESGLIIRSFLATVAVCAVAMLGQWSVGVIEEVQLKAHQPSPKYTVEDVLGLTNRFTVEYALGMEELKHDEK